MATLPQFVNEDAQAIVDDMKADMETRLNRSIAPADVEMLLLQGFAYREQLIRISINETARQNLVSFSTGSALEYLGELVGVKRLPASSALCTIRFNLVEGQTGVQLPAGLRVQSTDGKAIFATIEGKTIAAGTLTADIQAESTIAGTIGNGYDANKINIILDPQAYLSSAYNIDGTQGGADDETDDELRQRIMLAPASFSVAGPKGAYEYYAKSAHASIVDVAITSPTPGEVHIFPLLEGGQMPTPEILDAVNAICNGDKIRPLTDTVIVAAPSSVDYAIQVELTIFSGAVDNQVSTQVQQAMEGFRDDRKNKLGKDVVRSQITALCMIKDQVYNCNILSPAADVIASPEVYTNCTGITVKIIGTSDE